MIKELADSKSNRYVYTNFSCLASQFLPPLYVNFGCFKGPFFDNVLLSHSMPVKVPSCHFQPLMKTIAKTIFECLAKMQYYELGVAPDDTDLPTFDIT